jgi:hypothetical protein
VNLITGAIVSGSGATVVPIGDGWFRISLTAIADGTTQSRGIVVAPAVAGSSIYTGDGTSGIYIFGAQLSDSASLDPYSYNPVAAPTSTAYYGPRFDYDPVTLASKGLLIEEQRTNLLTYSSEFDNVVWTKTNATVSANSITAPDGTNAGDTLIAVATNTEHVVDSIGFSATAGTTYTLSGYVKAAGLTDVGLRFTIGSLWPLGVTQQVSYNLVTKAMTVINGQPSAYTITELNNGWFKITMSVACAVSGTSSARFQLMSGTNNIFTGNGSSGIYIWGAQLEAGAFPTSYIPTISATVTRAADNAIMVGSNFSSWYNQSEGTFVVNGDTVNSGNRLYFDVGANGAFGTTAYIVQTSTYVALLPGAAPVNMTSTVNTTTLTNKIATAMQNNNSIIAVNASLGVVDAACTMPASATTLTVGCSQFGGTFGNYLNGHIQSIKYYPTRLPNGTLQGLTA